MGTILVISCIIGFILWAASKATPGKPRRYTPALHWPSTGNFDFEIVGESNYQKALRELAGEHGADNSYFKCIADLNPEDDNKHDPKAIAVSIDGFLVGYLSRDDARSFRRRLGAKKLSGEVTSCDAVIVGGRTKKNGEKLFYGVRLDIKPFE